MNTAGKLGAYGIVLALALGGGAAIGLATGPIDTAGAEAGEHAAHRTDNTAARTGPADQTEEKMMGGGLTSQAGYTLEPEDTEIDGAMGAPLRFRITGPDGRVVRAFEARHDRELHLIVVSSDLATFAHLHPSRSTSGTWTAQLPALTPGVYRAVADFAPVGGPELTLGVNLAVPGDFRPTPLPEAVATDTVDGYEVTLYGAPRAGSESKVALTVIRDGIPVTDLEPYLGAFGHLVAIRAADLAYLHVHPLPEEGERGGPVVGFAVHVPSPGDYRLFFDFAHGGKVRTAAFTVHVASGGQSTANLNGEVGRSGHDTPEEDQ